MAKKWTNEEIQFLKFAYSNKDFTTEEISNALNRSKGSVKAKASSLNLKAYKETIVDGYKKCSRCENILPLSFFTKRGDAKHRYRSWCRTCRTTENKIYREELRDNATEGHATEGHITHKTCKDCATSKPIGEFYKNKNNKDNYDNYCKECSKIRKEKSMLKKIQERGW